MADRLLLVCAVASLWACSPAGSAQQYVAARIEGSGTPRRPKVSRAAHEKIVGAAKALAGSKSSCNDYDYFPGGGLRNFYCHAQSYVTVKLLAKLAGTPVYTKGPHKDGALDLNAATSFGHYNPKFVRWLAAAIPGLRSKVLRRALQPVYDSSVKPLARIFYVTGRKLHANKSYWERESRRYLKLAKAGKASGYYEQFYFFMNPMFIKNHTRGFNFFSGHGYDSGVSGNVVKTCVAFWIRRRIDRSYGQFYQGLHALLATYDATFLAELRKVKPDDDHTLVMKN